MWCFSFPLAEDLHRETSEEEKQRFLTAMEALRPQRTFVGRHDIHLVRSVYGILLLYVYQHHIFSNVKLIFLFISTIVVKTEMAHMVLLDEVTALLAVDHLPLLTYMTDTGRLGLPLHIIGTVLVRQDLLDHRL